jgi:hypothetical protein
MAGEAIGASSRPQWGAIAVLNGRKIRMAGMRVSFAKATVVLPGAVSRQQNFRFLPLSLPEFIAKQGGLAPTVSP